MTNNVYKIKISDIYIEKLPRDKHGKKQYVKIKEHPYFLSLNNNDKFMFYNYLSYSKYQSNKDSGLWRNFVHVYKDIKQNGFNFSNDDKIFIFEKDGKMICRHGRHRICMLYKIYGSYLKLKIENTELVKFYLHI